MELKNKKILLTGGGGFLGGYVAEELEKYKPGKIFMPSHKEKDLTVRKNCEDVVDGVDIVVHLAALIGGIGFIDEKPADLFYELLQLHLLWMQLLHV